MGDNSQCTSQSTSELWIFLIPSAICGIFTLLVNPLILVTILKADKLRKETRYILVANVMISDLMFFFFNTIISTCNAIRWYLHKILCFSMIVLSFAAYASCVLTFTVMVIDTYIAVCLPLHYYSLLSLSRTRKVLAAIWIFSILYPLAIFLATETFNMNPLQKQNMCLMFYYGANLYKITKQSGIWARRFSRAKVTLLTHSILLCFYIIPAFVLTAEIMMFKNNFIDMDARLWISAANNAVIMMMPRALAPVLYGLRYREISATIKQWFTRNRVNCPGPSNEPD
ncbi:hypothetical protein GDO86_010273 [Hymenochirus boettgeri]|uniref:G-protein coupled receptors family 1 profile domain-containing protein n=1 Tax=Hymenochirus boettgeri TaxID=247094 RepID=A0A8T2JPX0_9PIPI|nr:hypothetical protein GDO86_010273 [Hymenochirus boettgeri]